MDVLDFLRKFQQNNLLANVQLDLSYGDKNHVLPMLDKILPLISSIYSLNIHELFDWIYDNDDKEHEPLLKTVVEQTKILGIRWLVLDLVLVDGFMTYETSNMVELDLSSGTARLNAHGRINLIGAALGFTPQEMMESREH
jgi:hypothetical protein